MRIVLLSRENHNLTRIRAFFQKYSIAFAKNRMNHVRQNIHQRDQHKPSIKHELVWDC